jgi:hypothetical protein
VSLYEVNWQAADMEELLADAIPPLLAAAAANLSALLDKLPEDTDPPQQRQQQRLAGQLADMLYALAVLATAANEDAVAAAGAWGRDSTSSTGENAGSSSSSSGGGGGSSSSSSGAVHCRWYQSTAMQQLLDAVAAVGSSWDMTCVSRKVRHTIQAQTCSVMLQSTPVAMQHRYLPPAWHAGPSQQEVKVHNTRHLPSTQPCTDVWCLTQPLLGAAPCATITQHVALNPGLCQVTS